MKTNNKLIYVLYLILPVIFAGIIHLTFAYGEYSLDMGTWNSSSRVLSAWFGFIAIVAGISIAHEKITNNKYK